MSLTLSMARFLFPIRLDSGLRHRTMGPPTSGRGLLDVRSIADRMWVWWGGGHVIAPAAMSKGDHDCALASLYWAAPWIPESRIIEAFKFCTETWPYGGITNKEFQIALKYLKEETYYSADTETLGSLLGRQPYRCVALLHGHFIAIVSGKVVGRDAHLAWEPNTTVYCHWTFRPRWFQSVENSCRISSSTT